MTLDFHTFPGRWSHRDWLISLAVAVVIHHKGVDPVDWAIEKCKALPLSSWDADEEWRVFRAADHVAQTQMTIALYAVQFLADVGRTLDSEKFRAFAEQVWAHVDFVRRYSDSMTEDSVTAELAARVSVVLGEPDQEWLLDQAKNAAVDPPTLWALLDQVRLQCKTSTDVGALGKIREFASERFINSVEVNTTICTAFGEPLADSGCAPGSREDRRGPAHLPSHPSRVFHPRRPCPHNRGPQNDGPLRKAEENWQATWSKHHGRSTRAFGVNTVHRRKRTRNRKSTCI